MGIHQCGSLSSWPFFLSSSDENSLSNALSNEAVKEKLPSDVPTCLMEPSVFVICRAVAWSTFSTWHAAPAFVVSRQSSWRSRVDGVAAPPSHEDDEDAASKPFFATATKPYFSRPFAAHSAADGIGASMHRMSACALFAS